MDYSGRKFKLRIFPNNLFVRLLFLIIFPALLILSSHSKAIAEESSDTIKVSLGHLESTKGKAYTGTEDGSFEFELRFCFRNSEVRAKSLKIFTRNCARLHTYKGTQEIIHLENRKMDLSFKTKKEMTPGNFGFELRENPSDDTHDFRNFLKEFFSDQEKALIGGMCKQFQDERWLRKNHVGSFIFQTEYEEMKKKINYDRRFRDLKQIASRCTEIVENQIGEITLITSQSKTSNSKPENSNQSNSDLEGQIKSHVEGIYGLLEGKVGLSGKKRSSEEISAELGEILGDIDSISSWKDKTSQDVQQTMERIKDLRSALKDIKDNISSLNNWPDKQSEADIKEEEKDLTARLTYLKARDTSLEQELEENADLEELVESGSEKLTALVATIQDINKDIIDLNEEYETTITELNSKLAQADNLDIMLQDSQNNLEDLKDLQFNLTSNLSGAQGRKSELSPMLSDLVGQKSFLEITVGNLKSQTEATASINEDLETTYKGLLSERDMVTQMLNTLIPMIDDFENRISASNEKLSEIKTLMTNNYKEKSEIDILSTQAFALDQTVKSLEDQIEDLDDSVMAAEGKLNRFERTCKRKPECKKALNF